MLHCVCVCVCVGGGGGGGGGGEGLLVYGQKVFCVKVVVGPGGAPQRTQLSAKR